MKSLLESKSRPGGDKDWLGSKVPGRSLIFSAGRKFSIFQEAAEENDEPAVNLLSPAPDELSSTKTNPTDPLRGFVSVPQTSIDGVVDSSLLYQDPSTSSPSWPETSHSLHGDGEAGPDENGHHHQSNWEQVEQSFYLVLFELYSKPKTPLKFFRPFVYLISSRLGKQIEVFSFQKVKTFAVMFISC